MPFTEDVSPQAHSAPRPRDGQDRFPLSSQQELWCADENAGAFNPRFTVAKALRVTGHVDVAALQGALDDVVARHEILRTAVVHDTEPRHQLVHPPSRVPLVVRDRPVAAAEREDAAQALLTEAEQTPVPVDELPLLRAALTRFDDRDAVLGLTTHHTACDGWSLQLVHRDLAAFYAARTQGHEPKLSPAPQYRDYTRWQLDSVGGPAAGENMAYWRRQLEGANFFTLPTDRPIPAVHTELYVAHNYVIDAGTVQAVARLARGVRSSSFMVMLAAFNVLAHRISGVHDPVVNTMIHGRGKPEFHDTAGPFLNFLALRTDLAGCTSFRELITSTRNTCLEGYAHEVPIQHVEQAVPTLMAPMADPRNCDFIFGFFESPVSVSGEGPERDPFRIAESTRGVQKREDASEQIPGGAAWNMGVASTGEVRGALQYNPEEFDAGTAAGWVEEYCRIVANAVDDPDRAWKTL